MAKAVSADFVRVEGFVFSHVGDEGWTDSCAGELLRYRRTIGAEDVMVWSDIKKKHWCVEGDWGGAGKRGTGGRVQEGGREGKRGFVHIDCLHFIFSSHAVTADISISDVAKAAEFFCSDGVVVTGTETGLPAADQDIAAVKRATSLPLIVGSGVTEENLEKYHGLADALIVGSHFKVGGHWHGDVEEERVRRFMEKHRQYE